MFSVTGRKEKREEFEQHLWHRKKILLVLLLIPTLILIATYLYLQTPFYIVSIYWEYNLKLWARLFAFFFIFFFLLEWVSWRATTKSGYTFHETTYEFDEEGISIHHEFGGSRFLWSEVKKVTVSAKRLEIHFPQFDRSIGIPLRFFQDKAKQEAVITLIKKEVG